MKTPILIIVQLLITSTTFSQISKTKLDSLKAINYIDYNYKYLDSNYAIIITNEEFHKSIKKYKFYPERIRTWRDSLSVVLMTEFNNSDQARIAKLRISHSWTELGFYTWQSPAEAKKFASQFKINHPWKMRKFLIDEQNKNPTINKFYTDLKAKLTKNKTIEFDNLNRKELLTYAMRNNPVRIESFKRSMAERKKQREAYQKEHGEVDPSKLGVGCGKENCCQHKSKE